MTNKNVAVSIAYIAVCVQLGTYLAHDIGRLADGRVYWILLYTSGIALLGAVLWIVRLRKHPQN